MIEANPLRCVVLGAGGFLGLNLCRALAKQTMQVRAFARRAAPAGVPESIEWVQGDFLDPSSLTAAIEGCDVVFHLVNATTPASANADKVMDVQANVVGSLRLFDACRSSGVKRVIFVSSGGTIYGIPTILPTPESAPTSPITAYGISKLSIEKYLHLYEYLYGLDYRVLRVANPFGPHQTAANGQGVIGAFLQHALEGRTIDIWGDGSIVRDYIYVDDVSDALMAAASYEGNERIFNIGGGAGKSLLEIVASIEKAVGKKIGVRHLQGRAVDVPFSVLDTSLAQRELKWQPRVSYDEGIRRTLEWKQVGSPAS